MSSFFTELEEVAYSVVEYIPVLGTMYSYTRASVASREDDSEKLWQSIANAFQGGVRDVVLLSGTEEIATVAIVHTMAESLTDKIIEVWHRDRQEKKVKRGNFALIASEKSPDEIFKGKAKGVYHFHNAIFLGKLKDKRYATGPDGTGEEIRMDIRHGLYDGAPVTFSWKWTVDWGGKENRAEKTWGSIQLEAGSPTEFRLSKREGLNGWEGYDFWGKIRSKDKITAQTKVDGQYIEIEFNRVSQT